ncbi:GNAT family N-acetyltransferase [Synechococcus elongatus]|uniref:GNAT family N-acetyltransferase n=1 Tax=Synechococcus elongatus PCC 11802 TaxID=2283154 RepID=A0AAT9JSK5_SYNEL|nr:GNAT family N-acetyltransferase [Synechococcus elongatus]QFZ92274.1 N-acetyltransferase [Synechococcus elongatus PCC 11802]
MTDQLKFQWCDRLGELPREDWNAIAQPLATPFLEWDWLHDLEASGSVVAKAGWQACHLVVWRGDRLIAAAPLYLKGHSYGEFVFDQQWADLAGRLGLRYYPKLLGMTPLTPAVGYRFLIAPSEDEATLTGLMLREIDRFCENNQILSCNFLYVDPDWQPLVEAAGYSAWQHHNSVWQNHGFRTFDDYLGMFNANQRRNIKREVKSMERAGLELTCLSGDQIPRDYFPLMYRFYSDHCDKFGWWGSKYLTRDFFDRAMHNSRDRLLFVAATPEGSDRPIAMSFCVHKGARLYGRYWGCDREIDNLHFNVCYYKPIEWAIANGIQSFDPGAGGSHKKRRGFPATPNWSLHRWYQPRFGQILGSWLRQVNDLESQEIEAINAELPFSRPDVPLS